MYQNVKRTCRRFFFFCPLILMFFADDLVAAVALVASKFPNISSNFVRGVPIIYIKYMKCMKNYIISQVILAF